VKILQSEAALNELDAKVALLVKNRISLADVSHLKSRDMKAQLAKNAAIHEKETGILSLKGNNKDTKQKRRDMKNCFMFFKPNLNTCLLSCL